MKTVATGDHAGICVGQRKFQVTERVATNMVTIHKKEIQSQILHGMSKETKFRVSKAYDNIRNSLYLTQANQLQSLV